MLIIYILLALLGLWLLAQLLRWGPLVLRRWRFARQLEKICSEKKLRLCWSCSRLASLFGGYGEIDFVIDEHIHVAILSTPYRRASYHLGEDELLLMRQKRLRLPQRAGNRIGYIKVNDAPAAVMGYAPLALSACDAPEGDARVLIVYPAPQAVNDCRSGQAKGVGSGDAVAGGFQFNTRSQFFDRLEKYAAEGDMTVWMPRKKRKEWE